MSPEQGETPYQNPTTEAPAMTVWNIVWAALGLIVLLLILRAFGII